MNIETYKNIIDEADNKIMTGSIVTPQYVKLLSTLRIAVDEAGQTLYSGADDKKIKIWQAR